jgi:hypothetical protein
VDKSDRKNHQVSWIYIDMYIDIYMDMFMDIYMDMFMIYIY